MRRDPSDTILAVWPEYMPLHEKWFMQEFVQQVGEQPVWRDKLIPLFPAEEGGKPNYALGAAVDHYPDRATAIAVANALNPTLRLEYAAKESDPVQRRSIELKTEKALQSKRRLQDEEALMLAEALRRHGNKEPPDPATLKLAPESEVFREELATQLATMPYLRVAKIGRSNGRWGQKVIYRGARWFMDETILCRSAGGQTGRASKDRQCV